MTAWKAAEGLDEAATRVLAGITPDQPLIEDPTAELLRELVDRISVLNGPGPAMFRVSEHSVPGAHPGVRVRLLQSIPDPRGLIIGLGPGGWVAGTLDSWDCMGRKLAERTSCTVALVDVRRAPEHPYPAAADDVHAATRWLWQQRDVLGHAGLPHMIIGDGMGATLAAVTAARVRDDPDGPRLALQFLVCPVSVSPAQVATCTGLPPTLVVTAGLDPARAAGIAFVERLREAGVSVVHRDYAGQMHGFFSILVLPVGERVVQHVVRAVRGYTGRFTSHSVPPPESVGPWLERVVK